MEKHVPHHQPVVFIYSMFNGKIHYKWTFSLAMLEITRGHVIMSSMFRSFSPCHPTIFIISTSSFAGSVPGAVVPLRDGFKPAGHGSPNAKLLDMGWVKTYYFHRTGGTSYFGVITNVPGFDQPYLTWIMKNPTSTRGNDFSTSFFI
jgi:hypothetical protein